MKADPFMLELVFTTAGLWQHSAGPRKGSELHENDLPGLEGRTVVLSTEKAADADVRSYLAALEDLFAWLLDAGAADIERVTAEAGRTAS